MNRVLIKIASLLLVLIFLPIVILSVYQLSVLSNDEKALEEIYANQLESILFSVNQYSDDVVSSWAGRIERELISGRQIADKITALIKDFPPVENVIIAGPGKYEFPVLLSEITPEKKSAIAGKISTLLKDKSSEVSKLYTYYKSGYRKIESFEISGEENLILLLFVTQTTEKRDLICGIIINKSVFISEIISRRIAVSSGDKFTIAVISDKSDSIVFSNSPVKYADLSRKKELWVLKEYSLGIALKGETVTSAIRTRSQQSLILLISVNILFVIGLIFVFFNIRRQIRLAEIKSDFVSNVSHELRTPLALITMFAETLESGRVKTEEKKNEYYSIISGEANRLSKIVNGILNFSQLESGKRKFSFAKVSLNKIVGDVSGSYSFHLKNKGFIFEADLADELPELTGDKDALSEMLINLLDNAIKYSDTEKRIRIRTALEGKRIVLSVKDSGIGIAEKDRKQIFEKFYRISTGMVHNTKGTGLGLAIVKHIVESHKGEINVISAPGKGSEFIISFPLA